MYFRLRGVIPGLGFCFSREPTFFTLWSLKSYTDGGVKKKMLPVFYCGIVVSYKNQFRNVALDFVFDITF